MRRMLLAALVLVALIVGMMIAFVDTRPHWDDTGVTVGMLIVVCVLLGAARPQHPWAVALLVGVWTPALNILLHHNYGSIIALAFAFGGAYAGAYGRRLLAGPGDVV